MKTSKLQRKWIGALIGFNESSIFVNNVEAFNDRTKLFNVKYNMNKFTFGVMVYNQEKIVLETLNSIKYQVVHFGKEYDTQIIFTDDNSSDNTVKVIETWLDTNRSLFCSVIKHWNHENLGTS